jgi:hypothetical protein
MKKLEDDFAEVVTFNSKNRNDLLASLNKHSKGNKIKEIHFKKLKQELDISLLKASLKDFPKSNQSKDLRKLLKKFIKLRKKQTPKSNDQSRPSSSHTESAYFAIIDSIYSLSERANILPIEFDRFFYLLGSGKFSGLIDCNCLQENSYTLENDEPIFSKGGNRVTAAYSGFIERFHNEIKDFNEKVFRDMQKWLWSQYQNNLNPYATETKINFSEYVRYPYYPMLLEGHHPDLSALIHFAIGNAYASGRMVNNDYKLLMIRLINQFIDRSPSIETDGTRNVKLNLTESDFYDSWKEYIKSGPGDYLKSIEIIDRAGSSNSENMKFLPNGTNPKKDLELVFDMLMYIQDACENSLEVFYKHLTMRDESDASKLKSGFISRVKEIKRWRHFGVALSANFIKDLQISRELLINNKDSWNLKMAGYCCKPDLHLGNFVGFFDGKYDYSEFKLWEQENIGAQTIFNTYVANRYR